jgi:hypothetical protein
MSLKRIKPFSGIKIITSETDEMEVAHLLRTDESLNLVCQDCGGSRFRVEAFITAKLDILTGEHLIISKVDYDKVLVNKVIKCIHCDSEDFVPLQETKAEASV